MMIVSYDEFRLMIASFGCMCLTNIDAFLRCHIFEPEGDVILIRNAVIDSAFSVAVKS